MVLSANTHEKIFANSLFLGEEAVSRPPHGSTLDPLMEVRILQGQLQLRISGPLCWATFGSFSLENRPLDVDAEAAE